MDPPRLILQQGNNHQEDSSSDGEEQANSDGGNMVTAVRILPPQRHATEGAPVPVRPPTTAARTPPSPLLARNARRSLGQRQLWKKGRRSRQRFEEERRLLAQFVDQEDEEEAFTLVRESNSHFKVKSVSLHILHFSMLIFCFLSFSPCWRTRPSWRSSCPRLKTPP